MSLDTEETIQKSEEGLEDNNIKKKKHQLPFVPYLLVLALGIHAVFSGLALGLFDSILGFTGFLIVMFLHKWAEALAVGISFAKKRFTKSKAFFMIFIFSSATPLGCLLGLIFSTGNLAVKSAMLGISSGTFLYISTSEIVVEEFTFSGRKLKKFLYFTSGIVFMIILSIIELIQEKQN